MWPDIGALGIALGLLVGVILGLLGGGGSILALPIFLYVFGVPTKPAVAMSLAVVGLSAFVGFVTHWRQGTVNLRVGLPFAAVAMVSAFLTARIAHVVPEHVQLGLFAVFAFTAAFFMLRDSLRSAVAEQEAPAGPVRFTPLIALEAFGVGALTSIIGAGGGFVIVPVLVLLAKVPVRAAVGSSLFIITVNALSGFVGYIGRVPIDWPLVVTFTGAAAIGAVAGTRLSRLVPQSRIKQSFALLIIVLGGYLILHRLVT